MNKVITRKHGKWLARFTIATCLIFACIALTRKVQAAFLNYQVNTMTAKNEGPQNETHVCRPLPDRCTS